MDNRFVKINSLLDNDFYKFTMQHAVINLFPKAKARYEFINRGKDAFPSGFAEALRKSVQSMCDLKLSREEKEYLQVTCPYLDPTYLDFLQGYCYNSEEVTIEQDGGDLSIFIEGFWYRTILWEIPILSLVSELYYKLNNSSRRSDDEVISTTREKIENYTKLGVTVA